MRYILTLEIGARDADLSAYFRLHALNLGILLVPFESNIALIGPDITEAEIDHHTTVFAEAVAELFG